MDEPLMPDGDEDHSSFWCKVQNRYKYMDGGPYDRNRARSIKAAYYATISFIDYNIVHILDALGSDIDNTLIIFPRTMAKCLEILEAMENATCWIHRQGFP